MTIYLLRWNGVDPRTAAYPSWHCRLLLGSRRVIRHGLVARNARIALGQTGEVLSFFWIGFSVMDEEGGGL